MQEEKKESAERVLTIEEYLDRRKGKRKKEEGNLKVLTKFEWNVIIHE